MLMHRSPALKLFEITVAGRRFAVAREADGDQFYQKILIKQYTWIPLSLYLGEIKVIHFS